MDEIVIVAAKRSAIAKFNGSLKNKTALQLATAVSAAVINNNVNIDTIYLGNVLQAGQGQNIARQLSINLGLDYSCMATTINAVCGSGLQSIILGIQALKLHDSNACLVGGTESMSNAPHLLKTHRSGKLYGNDVLLDSIQHDGLFDHQANMSMIETAEKVAEKYNISREKQDLYAYHSQLKAIQALNNNKFESEIVAIENFKTDEAIRLDTTIDKIKQLKPVIGKTITAGNASGINDGAAMLLLMRKKDCIEKGLKPLAVIKHYTTSGCDNTIMGYAPYYAIKKLLAQTNTIISDYDLIEINEAFASQVLAIVENLDIDVNKLNVNGGAIALGHPLGASGARIVVSAVHELLRSDKKNALVSLCIGGGNAIALTIEKFEG